MFLNALVSPSRRRQKNRICILLRHVLGHEFLTACMLKEVRMITVMHVQNRMFIGSVFQIEVSDTYVYIYWRYVQIEARMFGILCVWE